MSWAALLFVRQQARLASHTTDTNASLLVSYMPLARFLHLARAAAYVLLSHRCGTTALRFYPTLLLVLLGALDKAAAKLGLRRVPEQTLCGLAVASGTAGALTGALALVLLQHKTRKQSFQLKYLIATGLALAIDNLS